MLAIFKREFKAYFSTPIGYIVLAIFFVFSGAFFAYIYSMGVPQVEFVIGNMSYVALFLTPIITMRLFSEDKRQKVDQALFAAPVKLSSIVFGKYFAALVVYALCFTPTIIFEIIVMSYVSVNILTFLYTFLGILLFGSAMIAIGMFMSCLTESMAISAFLTLAVSFTQLFMNVFINTISVYWIVNIVEKLSFLDMFSSFGENLFSLPDICYFLSITAAFLFLCVRALEKRRWA